MDGESSKEEASRVRIRFLCDLYSQIRKQVGPEENIMLAPTTLGTILATFLIGSRGRTREQILSALFPDRKTEDLDTIIAEAYANPLPTTKDAKLKRQVTLLTASKLYHERSCKLNRHITEKVAGNGVEIEKADFARNPDAARKDINRWVTDATKGFIKDLFDSSAITDETVLAIVAAIYFQATWQRQFRSRYTKPGRFYVREGKAVKVDFMNASDRCEKVYFSRSLDAAMLELPYESDDYCDASMIIILPKISMESTEEKLNAENLTVALTKLFASSRVKYDIAIPKFEVTAEYNLIPTLSEMGMTDLVNPELADLRSMLSPKNINRNPFYLETAVQRAVLKVDEEGTVGAAATSRLGHVKCKRPRFTCDHPFLTIVYEKRSLTVIFIGRIMNPSPTSD